MLLMGLDVGTTGCKALLIDESGSVKGYAFREYGIETGPGGKAEQDAETVWNLAKEVIKEASSVSGSRLEPSAIAVSVQGDAVIAVDSEFRPLRPAILGMDYRSAEDAAAASDLFGDSELFRRTGMRPHPINSLTKLMFLKRTEPAVFEKASAFVTYSDFIMGRLGARGYIDFTMASRTMAFDLQKSEWCEDILKAAGIPIEKLSEPVVSGTVVGELSGTLKAEFGFSGSALIVAGGHDQPCCAMGSGVTASGTAVVSSGTAEVMSAVFSEPKLGPLMYESYYPCYSYVLPGQFFTFSLNHVGGLLLRWFRDNFSCGESYEELNLGMPAEPTGLMILPHLNGSGTPFCDMEAKGVIAGLTMDTDRYDVYKAMMEAQCYELRLNKQRLAGAGVEIEKIIAVGGGARSGEWLQMKADVLGCEISTLEQPEAGCIGAAILAGLGAGAFDSPEDAAEAVVKRGKSFYPSASHANIYAEKYETYRELYRTMKVINGKIK